MHRLCGPCMDGDAVIPKPPHDAAVTLGEPCDHCGGCEWVCAKAAQEGYEQFRDAVLALLERKETGR